MELDTDRKDAIKRAIANYHAELEQARLGGLFKAEDYPTAEQLAAKYSFQVIRLPMPAGWKTGINDSA